MFYHRRLLGQRHSVTSRRVRSTGGQALTGILGALILSVAGASLFGSHGARQLVVIRQERQRLGERAVALLNENRARREAIRRLREDDAFLEDLARRELGLTRPNETVYRFQVDRRTAR